MGEASVWGVVVPNRPAAMALGQAGHVSQVRAFGLARSRAAFARALIAAGLMHGSPASVSKFVAEYGGTSSNSREAAVATTDGLVFVCPSTYRTGDPILPWPRPTARTEGRSDG